MTKVDLADAVEFDWHAAARNLHAVRPGIEILRVSAKTGCGMDGWLALLRRRHEAAIAAQHAAAH